MKIWLTIWLAINDCLTGTKDGLNHTNDIKSLHSQEHHGLIQLTDKQTHPNLIDQSGQ